VWLKKNVARVNHCKTLGTRRDVREHWLSSSPAAIVPEQRHALRRKQWKEPNDVSSEDKAL